MEWDIRNDQPIYTQLIQQVTLAILSGTFPCGVFYTLTWYNLQKRLNLQ